jgi:hypothetical protein
MRRCQSSRPSSVAESTANRSGRLARVPAGSGFRRRERAGSAKNWHFLMAAVRKCLILEANAATSHGPFATSHGFFATSPVSAPTAVAPFISLSNSLKKKKKEYDEGQESGHDVVPLVRAVLPSVADAAYFLGHEALGVTTGQ